MEQFEYFTTLIEADVRKVTPGVGGVPTGNLAGYTPYSLIPELNAFGAEGWELISIQPVKAGRNEDIRYPSGASADWGTQYFCAFKRRLA